MTMVMGPVSRSTPSQSIQHPPSGRHDIPISSPLPVPETMGPPIVSETASTLTPIIIRRRPTRHYHQLRFMTGAIILSLCALLTNYFHYCEALSRIPHCNNVNARTFTSQAVTVQKYHGSRGNKISSLMELSLFQRSNIYSPKQEHSEWSPADTNDESKRSRRKTRMQHFGRFVQKMRSKILSSSRNNHAIDDTIVNTGRARFASTIIGATASTKTNTRDVSSRSKYPQSNHPMAALSTAARMARVQSLANSPLASIRTSSSSSSSRTALHMVLSTPDSIIEQASTQGLLDTLLDESVRTQSSQPIMMQFNPSRTWIWRQWRGTVFSETWKSALLNMTLATLAVCLYRVYPSLKDLLEGFSILWGQLLSVTTFTLTFFLNQSYGLWRKCYDYSRRLQGRLNDLGMTLAAHATRTKPSSPDIPSTYTPQSRQALELVSRYVRVFNLLTYASFTRSHRPILTPRGMRRLVERGILTSREREILSEAEVPATQRHNAVLVWLIRLFLEGRQAGVFEGGFGFEQQFLEKCHVIRAQYGAIGDELQGRMPLAYAHIVQVLLDVVLWMYPFMALSTGMAWHISILGTGLLTMFYQGLFDLAKQFLDPYDNENYGKGDDPLVIDTLIAESNAGSVRWMNSFQQQPWNNQLLRDGELYDSILPLWGYSVEYLSEIEAQEEQERKEKELAKEEKKKKEEEMDRQRAEELLMTHHSNLKNGTDTIVGERWNGTAVLSPEGEVLMEGVMQNNKTLMEVSGGEVIATSSLLSPKQEPLLSLKQETNASDTTANNTRVEMESVKVLTLADGTLVTPDDILAINTTESEMTAASQPSEDLEKNTTSDAPVVEDEATTAVDGFDGLTLPTLLGDTNEIIALAKQGTAPNFQESIAEMADYKDSPILPLYNTKDYQVNFDRKMSDDELEDFEWFEEIGEDGQEYRLSQMLADEEYELEEEEDEADDAATNKTMTYDEFTQKASEIMERVESELDETKQILSVSPGNDAEYYVTDRDSRDSSLSPISLPARRMVMDEPEPVYDQTRLDGISQLWGAPPETLFNTIVEDDDSEQDLINDGMDFKNVYALWGEDLPEAALDEEESTAPSPSMDGFSQLWNEDLSPYTGGEQDDSIDQVDPQQRTANFAAFAGLEWWDEVSEDGKELRLSQMLADEEYEETVDQEVEAPMTFERFAEETEKLIEQAEDERKETEAIMNAPPNANFLEADDEDGTSGVEKGVVASDAFEEMIFSLAEGEGTDAEYDIAREIISEEEIGVLEMDEGTTGADLEKGKDSSEEIVEPENVLDLANKAFESAADE